MDRKKFTDLVENLHKSRVKLLVSKGHDYADKDVLANFKRMHKLCEILDIDTRRSPEDCAMFLAMLKIDRKSNLKREGKNPLNESVEDTMLDLHNYIDLAYGCECEESDE